MMKKTLLMLTVLSFLYPAFNTYGDDIVQRSEEQFCADISSHFSQSTQAANALKLGIVRAHYSEVNCEYKFISYTMNLRIDVTKYEPDSLRNMPNMHNDFACQVFINWPSMDDLNWRIEMYIKYNDEILLHTTHRSCGE